jgi:hypothetical protein
MVIDVNVARLVVADEPLQNITAAPDFAHLLACVTISGGLDKLVHPIYGANFAVRQMTGGRLQRPVPTHQGRVAVIFKQKFQRRRFDVAIAKDHVGVALVAKLFAAAKCKQAGYAKSGKGKCGRFRRCLWRNSKNSMV